MLRKTIYAFQITKTELIVPKSFCASILALYNDDICGRLWNWFHWCGCT